MSFQTDILLNEPMGAVPDIIILFSFYLQMGLVYTCSRLVVNVSQSYLPLYLTETLKFEKVSEPLLLIPCKLIMKC